MKHIKLMTKAVLTNSMDIDVMGFPGDDVTAEPRKRCGITVEYGIPEMRELRRKEFDIEGAVNYYRGYIYDMVRFLIGEDWEAISGMEEILLIIKEKISERL